MDFTWRLIGLFGSTEKAKRFMALRKTPEAAQILENIKWIESQKYECGYCDAKWTGKEAAAWPCPNCGGS